MKVCNATNTCDFDLVCSSNCQKSVKFMKQVYVAMRLKFKLKLINRETQEKKSRKNRKYIKITNN